jgi:glycosyltransferase involved in cell wall biosynthesis
LRVLLPAYEAGSGGLGFSIRGIREFVPPLLPEGDELVVLGGDRADGSWQRPGRRASRLLNEQLAVARAARGVDLVHLPDHRPLLFSRTPFLLTVYDVLYLDRPGWFPRSVARYKRRMLEVAVRRRPAVVVAGSEYTRGRLLAHFPGLGQERVRVVYPGIWPAPQAAGEDGGYFLTVSTIEPRKNHLGLLHAFRIARDAGFRLRWKVVGAPGYAAGPILAELAADPDVDVAGWLPDAELERVYAGARFAVYPSLGEGFGIPPLEAMARGVPVACSTGTPLDETVDDAALRVDPVDRQGWADALLRLDSDETERERLRRAGRELAARFDWPRAAAAYVGAYRAALA